MDEKKKNEIKKAKDRSLAYLGLDEKDFESLSKKTSGKILGIDYGTKNIGVAISDQEQNQAFVYDTLKVSAKLFNEIKEMCDRELVDKVVVGLPLSMKGEYSDKTNEVVCFIEELEARTKLIVETQDERLSSVEAGKSGSGHGMDEESARIILQQYLDRRK